MALYLFYTMVQKKSKMTKNSDHEGPALKEIAGHQNWKGVGGPSPEKIRNLRLLNPLKFNSESLSYNTENCRRLLPVRMIFTSLMTLKVKNKTWVSNFQLHMQAETETNLLSKFMFKFFKR